MFRNTGANAFAKNQMRLAYEDKRDLYCSLRASPHLTSPHLQVTASGDFVWLSGFMWLSDFMWLSGCMWLKVANSGKRWLIVAKGG